MTRDDSDAATRERLLARTKALGETARVVAVRIDGALDELCGRTGDRAVPTSIPELTARIDAIRRTAASAAARLLAAAGAPEDSAFMVGIDRAFLLVPSDPAVDARLTEARAAIESECLARWQGALLPVIAWADAPTPEILSESTAEALDQRVARRASTPFLDAMAGTAPCGPFDPAEGSDSDASRTLAAPAAAPLGVSITCRSRPSASALSDRIASESTSAFPTPSDRIARAVTAQGELFVGPLREVLAGAAAIDPECSIVVEGCRSDAGLPGALARARAAAVPSRGSVVLGVRAPRERLAAAVELGEALAPLAASRPAALRGLLDLAVCIDEGADRAPLLLLSRWRARAHAIAASLGVDERAVRAHPEGSRAAAHESALDLERPERRALKTLIREFPRWFDTGAARIPLWCALLGVESSAEVCSA